MWVVCIIKYNIIHSLCSASAGVGWICGVSYFPAMDIICTYYIVLCVLETEDYTYIDGVA